MNITRKKIIKRVIVKNKIQHKQNQKKFEKKIKKIDLNKIISIDEVSFDSYMSDDYGWSIKGRQIMNIKRKCKKRYTYICAISTDKIIYKHRINGSANALDFLNFITELVRKIGNDYLLLMDNARIHHSKILKAYLDKHNLNIIYNVPYSPEYNPIENVFSKVKINLRKKANNEDKLIVNIDKCFNKITKNDLKNYYLNSLR